MLKRHLLHDEEQYLDLIRDILEKGYMVDGRNGITKSIFGAAMRFDLSNGALPLLTTKKVAHKTCLKELLWFISGSTDNNILKSQGVKIWNDNASREFLDAMGLPHLAEDDLGPVYGHQWRYFNAPYNTCKDSYEGEGVDQLSRIVDLLKNPETRFSRRLVMSAWNPCQLEEMALPPCHVLCQFNVEPPNRLSCSMYQRSGDVGLGVPFNIASYSILTHLIAHHCGLEAEAFVYHLGNCHIYDDHIESLAKQVERTPFTFPTIRIKSTKQRMEDYDAEDIVVENYQYHPPIKMEMRA
jgi:thymidylate synthase